MSQSRITKAVIPAAGRGTRHYPGSSVVRKELFPLVDVDGVTRAALHLIVNEALSAGIEEVCIVVEPGGDRIIGQYFSSGVAPGCNDSRELTQEAERCRAIAQRLTFVEQNEPLGLGHAVWCARGFSAGDPVLVLLGDHIYLSGERRSCARQLLDQWEACGGSMSAVQEIGEERLHRSGVIKIVCGDPPWLIAKTYEKPTVELARRELAVPCLKGGAYLAWLGMHALQPEIFNILSDLIHHGRRDRGEFQLTSAQSILAERGSYRATPINGVTCDTGVPEGLALAQAVLTALGPFASKATRAASDGLRIRSGLP